MNEQVETTDMSSEAIATRLKRVSQLRRLCLSLGKSKLDDSAQTELLEDESSEPQEPAET